MSRFFGCCCKCSSSRKNRKTRNGRMRTARGQPPQRKGARKGVDYAITRAKLHLPPPEPPTPCQCAAHECRDRPDSKANVKCTRHKDMEAGVYYRPPSAPLSVPLPPCPQQLQWSFYKLTLGFHQYWTLRYGLAYEDSFIITHKSYFHILTYTGSTVPHHRALGRSLLWPPNWLAHSPKWEFIYILCARLIPQAHFTWSPISDYMLNICQYQTSGASSINLLIR